MARPEPAWRPPLREGVSASRVAVDAAASVALTDYLSARFPAAQDWPERLARGEVLDTAGQPLAPDARCRPGMLVWYWRQPPPEPRVPFEIEVLHHDDHLVVVDKPHFMSVTPGGRHLHETVLVRLKRLLGIATLAPLHRLDRETAGLVVFTVQPAERAAYHALMRERQVHKVYEAVGPWRAELALPCLARHRLEAQQGDAFMQMRVVSGEPNAQTRVELLGRIGADLAHYQLVPQGGRKHQLRLQMCALGLPIAGDRIYPRLWPEPTLGAVPDYSQPLQLLARALAFTDPIDGRERRFTSLRQLSLAAAALPPAAALPALAEPR